MYDTLSYVKRLEDVGIPREQAEVQVEIMSKFVDTNFATKQDLKDLSAELRLEMVALRLEIKNDFHEQTVKMGRMFFAFATIIIAAFGLITKL